MPYYDFKCESCKREEKNVFLRITHSREDRPVCCGVTMPQHFTVPPQVHWVDPVIEPFRHIAVKGQPVVTTTRQNREIMKRNGLINANDLGPPPTHEDQKAELKEINESIKGITPTAKQKKQLQADGLDSILD